MRETATPASVRDAILAKQVPAAFGNHLYGFVKDDYHRPDPATAVNVTAKWTCTPAEPSNLEELKHWWQRVGTDAFSMEEEMLRFEVYQVAGEDALIIHEVFSNNDGLKFHLTKAPPSGTRKTSTKSQHPRPTSSAARSHGPSGPTRSSCISRRHTSARAATTPVRAEP